MLNGILIIEKEKGYTSHDVVAKLRGITKQKKIGHTGTLDPDATGVLPVCLGRATKVCDMLTDSDKVYEAILQLGLTTDTQDITGEVLSRQEISHLSIEEVTDVIHSFIGDYDQIPPMYSALKVNGQKLCDLARKGIEVERKSRKVTIYGIDITEISLPYVRMNVSCSKGTYIRTLCQDIGEKLGVGGCMSQLRRTKAAGFSIEQALKLSEIEALVQKQSIHDVLVPVDKVFETYEAALVKPEFEVLYKNGNPLHETMFLEAAPSQKAPLRIYDAEGDFIGIYEFKADKRLYYPVKMFLN